MNGTNHSPTLLILLIDHQEETCSNTKFLLQLAGYEVMTATGLEKAINWVSVYCHAGVLPSVILLNNLQPVSDLKEKLDLLVNRCSNSTVLVVDRDAPPHILNKLEQQVIFPHHILTEIRKAQRQQSLFMNDCECFIRFHSRIADRVKIEN